MKTHQIGTLQVPSMDIDAWPEVAHGGISSASLAVQHEAVSPLRNSLTISGFAVR
jgi:hypothetical protein